MNEPIYLAYFTTEEQVTNPYYNTNSSTIEPFYIKETKQHVKFLYSDEELKTHLVDNGKDKITQWYKITRIDPKLKIVHSLELS